MNISNIPEFSLPPSLTQSNNFILWQHPNHDIEFWLENLKPNQRGVVKFDPCHITNANAVRALILRALPHILTFDFSQCTFSDSAFDILLDGQKTPRSWVLGWAPDQLSLFTRDHLKGIQLTIIPPPSPTAEDLELINTLTQNPSDENFWTEMPRSTLVKPYVTYAVSLAWWRAMLYTPRETCFKISFYLEKPHLMEPLSELLRQRSVEALNLTGIVFSDPVWKKFLNYFKTCKKINSLSLDFATLPQIELLFEEWGEVMAENMATLNLSRGQGTRTTKDESALLSDLLSKALPKLKKLQTLKLDNWNITVICDKLVAEPVKTPERKALLLSQNTSAETWKQLLASHTESALAIGSREAPVQLESTTSIENFFSGLYHNIISFNSVRFTLNTWRTLLFHLNKRPFITALSFINCHLSPSMIVSLKSVSSLTSLTLNSNASLAEKEGFCHAVKAVIGNLKLKTLRLENNLLTDYDIAAIFPALPWGLNSLYLTGNCITKQGDDYLYTLSAKTSTGSKRSYDNLYAPQCHIDLDDNPI